ncbi:hypothetical protein CDAR_414331 [Caerostris darwini]|uniref:Uncharacterized protein n=1 Tax=Caerostris darwini TaxID=1538125 RepID=A0AAV4RH66_9ARAC|nr:hypothetical protein CDAR_414331 [Caerostris darwini]
MDSIPALQDSQEEYHFNWRNYYPRKGQDVIASVPKDMSRKITALGRPRRNIKRSLKKGNGRNLMHCSRNGQPIDRNIISMVKHS